MRQKRVHSRALKSKREFQGGGYCSNVEIPQRGQMINTSTLSRFGSKVLTD